MKNYYTKKHPSEKCFNFKRACIAMLNCRKYLESQGFGEFFDKDYDAYSKLHNDISGTIIFKDNSRIDGLEFSQIDNTKNRDSLFEKIINEFSRFERYSISPMPFSSLSFKYDKNKVIRTTFFKKYDYWFFLSIADRGSFLTKLLKRNPTKFSFNYSIDLIKDFISNFDIADFEKYKQGLENAVKQDFLVNYSLNLEPKPELKPQTPKYEIQNPWDIEIDEIEEKKKQQRI